MQAGWHKGAPSPFPLPLGERIKERGKRYFEMKKLTIPHSNQQRMELLRLGILSTAGINTMAIFNVIEKVDGVRLQAVASRNLTDAEKYANKHDIPQSYGDYQDILDLPYIDAAYIPLPNSMHAEWAMKALRAGKHVLCEKPMAVSVKEAQELLKEQKKSGKVLMEAFHYRYHPLAQKVEEMTRGGELGDVVEVGASFCTWLPGSKHIRYSKELKGGALWDLGCYTVDAVRWIAGCDEAKVTSAEMKMMPVCVRERTGRRTGVDHTTRANLQFANGIKANIHVTFKHLFPIELKITGTRGSLRVFSPFMPVVPAGRKLRLPVYQMWLKKGMLLKPYVFPSEPTYYYQLCAFRDAILAKQQPVTSPEACIVNTKINEAIRHKTKIKE